MNSVEDLVALKTSVRKSIIEIKRALYELSLLLEQKTPREQETKEADLIYLNDVTVHMFTVSQQAGTLTDSQIRQKKQIEILESESRHLQRLLGVDANKATEMLVELKHGWELGKGISVNFQELVLKSVMQLGYEIAQLEYYQTDEAQEARQFKFK